MGLEENGLENSALEVPDSPSKPDEIPTELEDLPGHQAQDWQTVPSSEIENTSLPPVLEPKKTPRQPKVKCGKLQTLSHHLENPERHHDSQRRNVVNGQIPSHRFEILV